MTALRMTGTALETSKIPPQAPDLEQAVLGAAMLESRAAEDVADILRPEFFYVEANRVIYAAIERLRDRRDPIDILTVTQELRASGDLSTAGGAFYISQLTSKVASSANVQYHARIIAQAYIGREIIALSEEARERAYNPSYDVFDTLSGTGDRIMRLNALGQGSERLASDVADEVVNGNAPDLSVRSHFPDLDRFHRMEVGVNIVGARPGMGKTAFALSVAWRTIAIGKTPVFFASLEMPAASLVNRLVCGECGVPVWAAKRREHSARDREAMGRWHVTNGEHLSRLVIDDTAALDTASLSARVDRAKRTHGVGLVIVDYLQLLNVRGEKFKDRYSRVTAVSERLRILAKESGIPVMALSQLNRSSAKDGSHRRPSMADLRESGQIEQDADTILLLHRENYYDKNAPNDLEVIVAKNRDGEDGIVTLGFDGTGARVVDKSPWDPAPSKAVNDEPF